MKGEHSALEILLKLFSKSRQRHVPGLPLASRPRGAKHASRFTTAETGGLTMARRIVARWHLLGGLALILLAVAPALAGAQQTAAAAEEQATWLEGQNRPIQAAPFIFEWPSHVVSEVAPELPAMRPTTAQLEIQPAVRRNGDEGGGYVFTGGGANPSLGCGSSGCSCWDTGSPRYDWCDGHLENLCGVGASVYCSAWGSGWSCSCSYVR